MTLVFADSFADRTTVLQRYDAIGASTPSIVAGGGRNGGNCMRGGSGSQNAYALKYVPANAKYTVQLAVKWTGAVANGFIRFGERAANSHFALRFNTAGQLVAQQFDTTAVATGTTTLNNGIFHYIECTLEVADSLGRFKVRVDGNSSLELDYTGDTRNAGAGTIDSISIGTINGSNVQLDVADPIFLSGEDMRGDRRVSAYLVTANGTYTDFTPLSSTNASNVDDTNPDDDTTYNATTSGTGQRDSYQVASIPTNASIDAVQLIVRARKANAGFRRIQQFMRLGGTNYDVGGETYLSDNYQTVSTVVETNPATSSAFTPADINSGAGEIGVRVSG